MRQETRFGLGDVIAGVSVALVLIPQSIAYAALAGLPPVHGLYAAILPLIAAAFFVSSPYLQTGPGAMTSVLTFGALTLLATPLSTQYISLAALLALVVGCTRILVGMLRAGFIAYLMSQPVLSGFMTAAVLLIIASQLPTLLGVMPIRAGIVPPAIWAISHPGQWSLSAVVLGAGTLSIIVAGRRVHALFPGVLLTVVMGIAYSVMADYQGAIVGCVPTGLPRLTLALPWASVKPLIIPGFVIALVGFAEPAAIARTMATQSRQRWSANREFVSQGVANVAAAVSGGFPVGGSFARTMINRTAGGRTRWSGAITGLTVLAFLPMATWLAPLPQAVLAAIVISAVTRVADFRSLLRMVHASRAQAGVAWSTFAMTLLLAPRIDLAVLIGIGLGIAVHLWRERRIDVIRQYDDRTLTLAPVGVLYFGSAPGLDEALIAELAERPAAERLVLDLRKVGRIDYTGVIALERVAEEAQAAGLQVRILPGQPPQGARLLKRVFGQDSPYFRE